jgi:hypothetical protein
MFKSEEEAYDALAEFWLSAPADKHVAAWEWACQDYEAEVDDADKSSTPRAMLRANVSQVLDLLAMPAGSKWSDGVTEMFYDVNWAPTCWKVRNEQYMAERMADELKD